MLHHHFPSFPPEITVAHQALQRGITVYTLSYHAPFYSSIVYSGVFAYSVYASWLRELATAGYYSIYVCVCK